MNTAARELMERVGVSYDVAETLMLMLEEPPVGTFDRRELEGAGETKHGLLLGILAATDLRRFGAALEQLLEQMMTAGEELSTYDRGRLWHLEGLAAGRIRGAHFAASVALNRSVRLLIEAGSPRARAYLARVFDTTGTGLQKHGLLLDAKDEFERALCYRDEQTDEAGTALTLGNLGRLCMDLGDFEAAERYLEQDLEIVLRIAPEKTRLRTQLLSHLGHCELEQGRPVLARNRYEASAELARAGVDAVGLVFAGLGLASVALHEGKLSEVRQRLRAVREQIEAHEASSPIYRVLQGLVSKISGQCSMAEGRAEQAAIELRQSREQLVASGAVSPVETARILRALASALFTCERGGEGVLVLRDALRSLDATAADSLRVEVEAELREHSRDSWLLHAAGRFLGQEQIDFLLREAGRGGFRGTNEEVAILFSDIRGFTAISENLTPQEIIVFLNDYLGQMTRCVEYFGGRVDKFIGDAVMALFSLPEPRPQDPEQAALSALMMQAELERFNRKMPDGIPELQVGIGLHHGPVVAGLIGSPQKRSYTVIGDAVNMASRLEGMTKLLGANILVSSEITDRFPHPERFLLRPLGSYRPKGRGAAVEVAELMGEADRSPHTRQLQVEIDQASAALELFRGRRFEEAREIYRALEHKAAKTGRAVGYAFLSTESERALRSPPPPEWAGEIVLLTK